MCCYRPCFRPWYPSRTFTPLVHSAGPWATNQKRVVYKCCDETQYTARRKVVRPNCSQPLVSIATASRSEADRKYKNQELSGGRKGCGLTGAWVGDLQRCGWLPPKNPKGRMPGPKGLGKFLGQARDEVHAHGVDGLPTSHPLTSRLSDSCLDFCKAAVWIHDLQKPRLCGSEVRPVQRHVRHVPSLLLPICCSAMCT